MAGVLETDRMVIKMLLSEAKADFEETVEDIGPEDLVSAFSSSLVSHAYFSEFLF